MAASSRASRTASAWNGAIRGAAPSRGQAGYKSDREAMATRANVKGYSRAKPGGSAPKGVKVSAMYGRSAPIQAPQTGVRRASKAQTVLRLAAAKRGTVKTQPVGKPKIG